MITPKKKPAKKPAIDLSKCKLGQRVRLRNGELSIILAVDNETCTSFNYDGPCNFSWMKNGSFAHNEPHRFDIVELLPPAKPVKPLDKAAIRRVIALLEGLL